MMGAFTGRTLLVARAIHRALLVLAPRATRRAYRAEMLATFEAASEAAARRGSKAIWLLLARELFDLATASRANLPGSVVFPPPPTVRRSAPAASGWRQDPAWRQAARSLLRRPAFFAATVVTLAFGAGVTTAVFSLVDTVLIRPLPYPNAGRLVTVYEASPAAREKTSLVSPVRLEDWHRLNRTFVALSGAYTESVTDTSGADPERLAGVRVTPRFFAVYGAPPLVGRTFTEEEERMNGPGAAVISERFWTRRFHRDPAALGHALLIGGRPYPIVGVMPATFTAGVPSMFAGGAADVWLPAQLGEHFVRLREARFLGGIGRLRPGITIDRARADLAAVQEGLAREFPASDAGWSVEIRELKDARIGESRRGLILVFGAVASLWMIAVANIAGLMLVHLRRRSRELAIRAALGASRVRVISTVVREGAVIALLGGTLGAGLASVLVSLMPVILTSTPRINELALNWRALAFTAATTLCATLAFTVIPAVAGTGDALSRTMSTGPRGGGAGRHRFQQGLVVAQVALSVLLVGAATLLLRSYYNLTRVERGLDAAHVVTFHVAARWDEDRTRIGQLQKDLIARLEQLPHVQAAGMTNFLPLSGATLRYPVRVEGLTGPNEDGSITAGARMVTGGYLRAIRVRLVAGSWCPAATLDPKAPRAVIVNQRFVDLHAPNQNLVGRHLEVVQQGGPEATIVGVVGTVAEDGPASGPAPYVYSCTAAGWWPDPEYVVRTADMRALAADLRRIVRELDSTRAIFGLHPLEDVLDAALDRPRLDLAMLGLFAGAAVTLAALGLYSLFMLVVSERAREMAVRLAVGASPHEVVRLVMAGAGRLLVLGIAIGVGLTAAADRVFRGVLFGVSPLDAPALAAAMATLAVVALLAVAGPALKAARVAPIEALKAD